MLPDLSQERLSLFFETIKKINSNLGGDTLIVDATRACKLFLESESASIFLLDDRKEILFNYFVDKSGKLKKTNMPVEESLAKSVFLSGKSVRISDVNAPSKLTKNLLCVPLVVKKKIIGATQVVNHLSKNEYEKSDEDLLRMLSEHIAIAIDQQKIFKTTALKIKQLSAICNIANIICYFPSLDKLLRETSDIIGNNFSTKRISIILFDQIKGEFKFRYGVGISKKVLNEGTVTIDNNILSQVKKQQSGVFCNNILADVRFGVNKRFRYQKLSFISVPLIYKRKVLGFISATERSNEHHFDKTDLDFMQTIADEFIKGYLLIESKKVVKKNRQ